MAKIQLDSIKIFGDAFAPTQIFNAIPSPLFSAAAELATLRHPRRPIQSDALEERIGKAKSSMVASDIPNISLSLATQNGRELIALDDGAGKGQVNSFGRLENPNFKLGISRLHKKEMSRSD